MNDTLLHRYWRSLQVDRVRIAIAWRGASSPIDLP